MVGWVIETGATQMTRVSFDTLLGGYSVERLTVGRRGYRAWLRLSNHPTKAEADAAAKTTT
jgi:hypothetical protein